jgi:hypothetical protein
MIITIEVSTGDRAKVTVQPSPPPHRKDARDVFVDVFNLYPHLHPYFRGED